MRTKTNEAEPNLGLVRGDERQQCSVAAKMRAASEFEDQWQLTEGKDVSVDVVDYSAGGLGLHTRTFVPRGGVVVVRVERAPGKTPLECTGRVQRVQMIDRTPTYYVGLAFVEGSSGTREILDAICATGNA